MRHIVCSLVMVGCMGPRAPAPQCTGNPTLLLTTTDFVVGALARVDDQGCVDDRLATTGSDALLARMEDEVLLLERGTANVLRRLDPLAPATPVWEVALESGANAHDVAMVADTLWVAQYDLPEVSLRDPVSGAEVGSLSLDAFNDADGLAEADSFGVLGGRLFLALQQFDRTMGWVSDSGWIVEIDPIGATVVQSWSTGPSPRLVSRGPDAQSLIVVTGTYGVADGALSVFDGATLVEVATEAEIGGDLGSYAESNDLGVMAVTDFELGGEARLACVDWPTGDLVIGKAETAWYVDIAVGEQSLEVGVRRGWGEGDAPGVAKVDPDLCELHPSRVVTSLEPYSLLALQNGA